MSATIRKVFAVDIHAEGIEAYKAWHRVGGPPQAVTDYRLATYRQARVLLMGSEGQGLSAELQGLCDELVRIPMVGRSDSLNLAVSTALVLYEIFRRQRPVAGAPEEVRLRP